MYLFFIKFYYYYTTDNLDRRHFKLQRISFFFHFLMAHRYYHRFPREASGRLFRKTAMSVMSLRHLMNHIVYGQLLHVGVRLISLDHRRRRYSRDRVLALSVIVIVIVVIVVVIVVLVASVIVAGIGRSQLLHFHSRHRRRRRRRRHGRRHRVLGAAFSRAFRHPAVSHGCKEMGTLGRSRDIR